MRTGGVTGCRVGKWTEAPGEREERRESKQINNKKLLVFEMGLGFWYTQ
jgi:hypothetical protein